MDDDDDNALHFRTALEVPAQTDDVKLLWLPATLISLPRSTTLPLTAALTKNKSDKNIWLLFPARPKVHNASKSRRQDASQSMCEPWLFDWLGCSLCLRTRLFFSVISASCFLPFPLLTCSFVCLLYKDGLISTPRRLDKPSNLPAASLHFSLLCLIF